MVTPAGQSMPASATGAPAILDAWLAPSNHEGAYRRVLAAADVLGILVGLSLALLLADESFEPRVWIVGALTLPAWIVLFKVYGLYDRDDRRVSHSTVDDLPFLFHALLVGAILLGIVYEVVVDAPLSSREGLVFFAAALVAILTTRAGARAVALVAIPSERALLLGGGKMAELLFDKIRAHPEYRLHLVGFIEAHSASSGSLRRRLPYLGHPAEIERVCRESAAQRVIVVSPSVDAEALADLIRRTRSLHIRMSVLPQLADVLGSSVVVDNIEGITVLGVNPPMLNRSSRFLKRIVDVMIAFIVLVLTLPFLALIALTIKMTSRGPVFFTQLRVGRRGCHFRLVKFRTMVADAEQQVDDLRQYSAHPAWLKLEHDPRVTRFGWFLRRLSLDELPQLWNVLRGEMSLVGPRPMPLDVDEKIAGWGRRRLDLTPGLTGLWQVLGRTDIPFEEMVKLDYLYVSNWSLWQDFRILIHTLPVVVRRRGVN